MLWLLFALARLDGFTARIAVDGDAIYVLGAHLARVDKATGAVTELAPTPIPAGLAVDDRWVYFSTGTSIERVPKMGGRVDVVASGIDASELAIAGDWLYFLDHDALERVPRAGGRPEVVRRGVGAQLAVAGGRVWWTNAVTRETPHSRDQLVGLRSAPIGGGPDRAEGIDVVRMLVVDDRLVWSDPSDIHVGNYLIRGGFWLLGGYGRTIVVAKDGRLFRVTLPAGDPDVPTLVELPEPTALADDFAAFACAVDASGVYFVSSSGKELARF